MNTKNTDNAKLLSSDVTNEIMLLANDFFSLEPNAQHVLHDFVEGIFYGRIVKKYDFDEMLNRQLEWRLDRLLQEHPCKDVDKIANICWFAVACFAGFQRVDNRRADIVTDNN